MARRLGIAWPRLLWDFYHRGDPGDRPVFFPYANPRLKRKEEQLLF